MQDTTRTIQSSIARFFSGTLLSRLSGLTRDILMAAAFGCTASVAAFLMAYRFSYLLRRLFGDGALNAAFVPRFEEIRHQDREHALRFFRDVVLSLCYVLLVLVGLGELGLVSIWAWSSSPDTRQVVLLTMLMLPNALFLCLYAIQQALLQCERVYFIPSVAPLLFNVTWIVAVLLLWSAPLDRAMIGLSIGIVAAGFVQWGLTFAALRRRFPELASFRFWRAPRPFSPEVRSLIQHVMYGMIGIGAAQVNGALDYVFARIADATGPAYLWYAFRVAHAPIGLFGVAVAGAVLPPLSRAIKRGDHDTFQHFSLLAFRRALLFVIPCALLLLVAGDGFIALFFGRGEFDLGDFVETTRCLWGYAPGIIGTVLVMVSAPVCYARGDYRTPAMSSVIAVIVNTALNALFVLVLDWGPTAVAASTSVSSLVNAGLLLSVLRRRGDLADPGGQLRYMIELLLICSGAALGLMLRAGTGPLLLRTSLLSSGTLKQASSFTLDFTLFVTVLAVYTGLRRQLTKRIRG